MPYGIIEFIIFHVVVLQLMVLTLRGASGQNAQRRVVEERACVIAPAPTLQRRTEGRRVWIRDWAQN